MPIHNNQDGVNLNYEIDGIGDLNFILIHNAGGDRHFMVPLFQHLSQFGRVLNMDLRGHGKSDKPKQIYTIEGFADDIAFLCKKERYAFRAVFDEMIISEQ